MMRTIDEIKEAFDLIEDWEERYQMIIDFGKSLPEMDETLKTESHKVEGCVSQVWMAGEYNDNGKLHFIADSDAHIVRGLIGLLLVVYQDKTPEEIKEIDIEGTFAELGLEKHLSPNRRNGFYAMVQKINQMADAA